MDAETLHQLRGTLKEVFADASDAGVVTKILGELGWNEVCSDDPAAATPALFEEQGRALASSAILNTSLLAILASAPDGVRGLTADTAVALPVQGALGSVRAIIVGVGSFSQSLLPVGGAADGPLLLATTANLEVVPRSGFDGRLNAIEVRPGQGTTSAGARPAARWSDALAEAHRSLASELVGVGQGALELATLYVSQRSQFGRPIGSYQAVRHRLAESFVHLTAAQELVAAAWQSQTPLDAAVAKVAAGRAADHAVRGATQVFGAIGLTEEHPLHRYVRRAATLDALAFDAAFLEHDIGRDLASGSVSA